MVSSSRITKIERWNRERNQSYRHHRQIAMTVGRMARTPFDQSVRGSLCGDVHHTDSGTQKETLCFEDSRIAEPKEMQPQRAKKRSRYVTLQKVVRITSVPHLQRRPSDDSPTPGREVLSVADGTRVFLRMVVLQHPSSAIGAMATGIHQRAVATRSCCEVSSRPLSK